MTKKTVFVSQADYKGCLGAAAAMAVGEGYKEFESFVGRPAIDQAYSMMDCIRFLLSRDHVICSGLSWIKSVFSKKTFGENISVEIDAAIACATTKLALCRDLTVDKLVEKALSDLLQKEGIEIPAELNLDRVPDVSFSEALSCVYIPLSSQQPAIAVVKSWSNDVAHACYWDGQNLYDPAKLESENPVDVRSYSILKWLPVDRVESDVKNLGEAKIMQLGADC